MPVGGTGGVAVLIHPIWAGGCKLYHKNLLRGGIQVVQISWPGQQNFDKQMTFFNIHNYNLSAAQVDLVLDDMVACRDKDALDPMNNITLYMGDFNYYSFVDPPAILGKLRPGSRLTYPFGNSRNVQRKFEAF